MQNTQTQNSNTQKIENSNPNLYLWVFLGAYVCVNRQNKPESGGSQKPIKLRTDNQTQGMIML